MALLREVVDKVIQLEKWEWREGLRKLWVLCYEVLSHLYVQSLLA